MLKRCLATLLVLTLSFSIISVSFAEAEDIVHTYTSILAPELDSMATAGTAIKTSNRAMSVAVLMFDFIIYQQHNDMELEKRFMWNDCILARSENLLVAVLDLEDNNSLVIMYDTMNGETFAQYWENTSVAVVERALKAQEYTTYAIDGDEMTDEFQLILSLIGDD